MYLYWFFNLISVMVFDGFSKFSAAMRAAMRASFSRACAARTRLKPRARCGAVPHGAHALLWKCIFVFGRLPMFGNSCQMLEGSF